MMILIHFGRCDLQLRRPGAQSQLYMYMCIYRLDFYQKSKTEKSGKYWHVHVVCGLNSFHNSTIRLELEHELGAVDVLDVLHGWDAHYMCFTCRCMMRHEGVLVARMTHVTLGGGPRGAGLLSCCRLAKIMQTWCKMYTEDFLSSLATALRPLWMLQRGIHKFFKKARCAAA